MVRHTEQTKANKERTDHNHHENWNTLYLIVKRMKQKEIKVHRKI